jgi:2-oxoglutarate ferredoxin oxidoreductase subunit beta
MEYLMAQQAKGEIVSGLLYIDSQAGDLHQALKTSARPLNAMAESDLCPGATVLAKLNAGLR